MTTRRAPELYSFGNYYAAPAAPTGAPDPISRPPRYAILSPPTNNTLFRENKATPPIPKQQDHHTQTTAGRRNNNSRNRVSTKSLSAFPLPWA